MFFKRSGKEAGKCLLFFCAHLSLNLLEERQLSGHNDSLEEACSLLFECGRDLIASLVDQNLDACESDLLHVGLDLLWLYTSILRIRETYVGC